MMSKEVKSGYHEDSEDNIDVVNMREMMNDSSEDDVHNISVQNSPIKQELPSPMERYFYELSTSNVRNFNKDHQNYMKFSTDSMFRQNTFAYNNMPVTNFNMFQNNARNMTNAIETKEFAHMFPLTRNASDVNTADMRMQHKKYNIIENRNEHSADKMNPYCYVDHRIPFSSYFLNLKKLMSASTKKRKFDSEDDNSLDVTSSNDSKNGDGDSEENSKLSQRSVPSFNNDVRSFIPPTSQMYPYLKSLPSSTTWHLNDLLRQSVTFNKTDDQGHSPNSSYSSSPDRKISDDKSTPLKKYKCDVCDKAFSRSNTLVTHKRIHTGDKPFKCEVCDRAFRQPGNLTRHRLTHTTIKPYVCSQCNKAFNRASNLHTHMRTHTNYKPFVCPHCDKGFHQKIDMKIHCYTHTGEKPHKCSVCDRGFKQLTHLNYHLRTHSQTKMYHCEHCGKGFNQKGNLQAHVFRHTGERPFKCDLCDKGFTLVSTLNTHRRTHSESKPFGCQHCSKEFYHKSALKNHLLASHPYTGEFQE